MCGRYASSLSPDDLVREFEIAQVAVAETLRPDYNVAPTKPVYAVLERPARRGAPAVRQLRVVSWGLVPSWAASPAGAARLINARMETVAEKPAFRQAFAARRCLLPADGYFEWYGQAEGEGRKQPYFIRHRDGGVLAMAGVYELWRDPARDASDPARWLWTAAVITAAVITAASDGTGEADSPARLHDRMPLLVPPDRYDDWLDPAPADTAGLRHLLVPPDPARLVAYPVRTLVNSVANNGPELVEPAGEPARPGGEALDATLF